MNTILFLVLSALALMTGISATMHSRRTRDRRVRERSAKWALGAYGSLAIALGVMLLSEFLPLLVTAVLVYWFARYLKQGRSPILRFVEQKIAKSS